MKQGVKILLTLSLLGNVMAAVAVVAIFDHKNTRVFLQDRLEHWLHPRVATSMAQDGGYRNRMDHFHALSALGARSEIVFAGDSHVEKADWSLLLGQPVSNRGIGGETLHDFRQRLPDVLAQHPRLLMLQIGSNDEDELALPPLRIDQLVNEYAQLLDFIAEQAPSTRLMVTAILPTVQGAASNTQLPALNKRLLALCAAHAGCISADASAALTDAQGNLRADFSFDGTHLNGAGYAAWSSVLKPLVAQALAGSMSMASP